MRILTFILTLFISTLAGAADPVLCDEVANDPLARSYATMTNAEIAADLNTAYRTTIKETMTGTEIFQAVDTTEFLALVIGDRDLIMQFFSWEQINPSGNEASIFLSIFGGASATITNLLAVRQLLITRAEELGLPRVLEGSIEECP